MVYIWVMVSLVWVLFVLNNVLVMVSRNNRMYVLVSVVGWSMFPHMLLVVSHGSMSLVGSLMDMWMWSSLMVVIHTTDFATIINIDSFAILGMDWTIMFVSFDVSVFVSIFDMRVRLRLPLLCKFLCFLLGLCFFLFFFLMELLIGFYLSFFLKFFISLLRCVIFFLFTFFGFSLGFFSLSLLFLFINLLLGLFVSFYFLFFCFFNFLRIIFNSFFFLLFLISLDLFNCCFFLLFNSLSLGLCLFSLIFSCLCWNFSLRSGIFIKMLILLCFLSFGYLLSNLFGLLFVMWIMLLSFLMESVNSVLDQLLMMTVISE